MDVDSVFSEESSRAKARLKWILLFLSLAALVAILYAYRPYQRYKDKVVICLVCDFKGVLRIEDIETARCPRCGGRLGYVWKCAECDYEFIYVPRDIQKKSSRTLKEIQEFRVFEQRCPNCRSLITSPVSPVLHRNMPERPRPRKPGQTLWFSDTWAEPGSSTVMEKFIAPETDSGGEDTGKKS